MKISKQDLMKIIKEELQSIKEGKGSWAAEKNKRYITSISGPTDYPEDVVQKAKEFKKQLVVITDAIKDQLPPEKHDSINNKAKYIEKNLNSVIRGVGSLEISQFADLLSREFDFEQYVRAVLK